MGSGPQAHVAVDADDDVIEDGDAAEIPDLAQPGGEVEILS